MGVRGAMALAEGNCPPPRGNLLLGGASIPLRAGNLLFGGGNLSLVEGIFLLGAANLPLGAGSMPQKGATIPRRAGNFPFGEAISKIGQALRTIRAAAPELPAASSTSADPFPELSRPIPERYRSRCRAIGGFFAK